MSEESDINDKKLDLGTAGKYKADSQQDTLSGSADCSAQFLINQVILSQLH